MFWITTALITLLGAAWMLRVLLLADTHEQDTETGELRIYRDQLNELENDLERGLLTQSEAEASRLEVKRRLLRAADKTSAAPRMGAPSRISAALLLAITAAGSYALYMYLGAPGLPDQPRADRLAAATQAMQNRPDQLTAEAQFGTAPSEIPEDHSALLDQLWEVLQSNRGNEQGFRLYIVQNLRIERYAEAYRAQQLFIEKQGDAATGANFTDLSEYMIFAAGGFVSPEAEANLVEALKRDPADPRARYFSGLMALQNGRPDFTFTLWQALENEGHRDSYWMQDVSARLPIVADLAGARYEPPEFRGPSQGDIADAQDMNPEDRQEMIQGMVASLAERLTQDGGSVAEWARLIRAYGVLGQVGNAASAWENAQEAYADDPLALRALREAARDAEVSQ